MRIESLLHAPLRELPDAGQDTISSQTRQRSVSHRNGSWGQAHEPLRDTPSMHQLPARNCTSTAKTSVKPSSFTPTQANIAMLVTHRRISICKYCSRGLSHCRFAYNLCLRRRLTATESTF